MDLKVSHGYVHRCKVMSETTWKLGGTKLMSKEDKSFLKLVGQCLLYGTTTLV